MASSSDSELGQQLIEAGNKLLDPPSSVEDLLSLLDKAEYYLSRVEQSPNKSIIEALSPCTGALVADELFKHSDADVMVAVASCISEITRITAPEAPYTDEEMKEIFRLIVSSFEHLDDQSSRSYTKRTSILEILAKVRSCVVLLDLECDALIVEMFQHFFKAIRDHHPERVFSSMETIMTLVLEESEDISPKLLSPILDILKKDNEGVLPISKKLGEKVLQNCSTKLKDFLGQALVSLGSRMDDYSEVVSMICQDGTAEDNNTVATPPGQHEVKEAASPRPDLRNGVQQTAEDNSLADTASIKPGIVSHRTRLKITGLISKDKTDNLDAKKEAGTAHRPKKTGRKRGRKWSTVKKSTKPSGSASADGKKQPGQPVENGEDPISNLPNSPQENQSIEADLLAEGDKEINVAPSPRETIVASLDVSSPSKTEELKKKEGSNKESEGPNESDIKINAELGKKSRAAASEDRTPIRVRISKKGTEPIDDAKTNTVMPSTEKLNASTAIKEGSSLKSLGIKDKKGTAKGKKALKDMAMSSEKDADGKSVSSSKKKNRSRDEDQSIETPKAKGKRKRHRDEDQPAETPKDKGKRKRTPAKEVPDAKEYGEDLVGSKVKVWWPKDKAFYEGVVESFDAVKKKHTVLYNDGDVEKLNLRKEKWTIIQDDSGPNKEQEVAEESRESTPEMPLMEILRMRSRSNKKLSAKKGKGSTSKKREVVSPTSDHKPHSDSKNDANLETGGVGGKADNNTPNIGSKLVGLARRMTSKSKWGSETKKENDETKEDKSKEDLESTAKGRTRKSVGRPKKRKYDGSDKVKSGSSVMKPKDGKDADIDSGEPPNRDKSSLSKLKLKENKVDRDSGEDPSDKVKSGLLKLKPKESKEKPSLMKLKPKESKEKNSDSGEDPSDKVKSGLLKLKPKESKERPSSMKLKPKESKEKNSDSGEETSDKVKTSSMKAKQKPELTHIEEVDKYSEEPSDKVKSSSLKPKPEDSEDVNMDSGEEPSDKVEASSTKPKQKPKPKESETLDEDSAEELSDKLEPFSLTPKEELNLKESEEVDKNLGEEPSDKVKSNSLEPKPDPKENEVVDWDSGEEDEKDNASEEEKPHTELLRAPSGGQRTGKKRRRGA